MPANKRPNWINGHVRPDVLAELSTEAARRREHALLLHLARHLARVWHQLRLRRVRHGPRAVHRPHEAVLLS